ncbi:DNA/RNA non-specific endonuclease [Arthrobacter sp. MMS24-T111]
MAVIGTIPSTSGFLNAADYLQDAQRRSRDAAQQHNAIAQGFSGVWESVAADEVRRFNEKIANKCHRAADALAKAGDQLRNVAAYLVSVRSEYDLLARERQQLINKSPALEFSFGVSADEQRFAYLTSRMTGIERTVINKIEHSKGAVDAATAMSEDYASDVAVNSGAWWAAFGHELVGATNKVVGEPVGEVVHAATHPVETLTGLAHAFRVDPLGTVGQMFTGIIDVDAWKKDPATAMGQMATGILLSLAGGKLAGLVAKGARGAAAADAAASRIGLVKLDGRGQEILEASSGRKYQQWPSALRTPEPNSTYLVDGKYVYVTDSRGRVTEAGARIERTIEPGENYLRRNENYQSSAGGFDRLEGDQGGHIFAAQFGGPGDSINLVAMSRQLNQPGGAYAALETQWKNLVNATPPHTVDVKVRMLYSPESARPSQFIVEYKIDGGKSLSAMFLNE